MKAKLPPRAMHELKEADQRRKKLKAASACDQGDERETGPIPMTPNEIIASKIPFSYPWSYNQFAAGSEDDEDTVSDDDTSLPSGQMTGTPIMTNTLARKVAPLVVNDDIGGGAPRKPGHHFFRAFEHIVPSPVSADSEIPYVPCYPERFGTWCLSVERHRTNGEWPVPEGNKMRILREHEQYRQAYGIPIGTGMQGFQTLTESYQITSGVAHLFGLNPDQPHYPRKTVKEILDVAISDLIDWIKKSEVTEVKYPGDCTVMCAYSMHCDKAPVEWPMFVDDLYKGTSKEPKASKKVLGYIVRQLTEHLPYMVNRYRM